MRESRVENVIAYMAAGMVSVSILGILVTLIAALFKFKVPAMLMAIPLIGLPLGFVLIIVLLVISIRKKSKSNQN